MMQLADHVKLTHVRPDGEKAVEDEKLANHFTFTTIGSLSQPTTIVDKYRVIVAWYLPGILGCARMV